MILDRPEIPSLDRNGSAVLTAPISPPPLQADHAPGADYQLGIDVTAQSWRFGHVTPFPEKTLAVAVFPDSIGWTRRPGRVAESSRRVYHGSGYVYTGKPFPAGLHAMVSFLAPASSDPIVDLPGFGSSPHELSPSPAGQNGLKGFAWEFSCPALEALDKRKYEIVMTPRMGQPAPDWGAVASSLEVNFLQ